MKRKKVSTHTPGMPMRLFILMMGIFAAGIHAFIFRTMSSENTDFPLFLMGLVLFLDAFLVWWGIIFMTQSRVNLFEEGIELERGGSKVFTPWENVSHLGIKGHGRSQKRGIFLYEKVVPETRGLIEKVFFGWHTNFLPVGRYVNLPRVWNPFSREINTDKLLNTEFGQDLYDLAPHLFEEYDDWKPKNQLRDEYSDESQPEWLEDIKSTEKKVQQWKQQ